MSKRRSLWDTWVVLELTVAGLIAVLGPCHWIYRLAVEARWLPLAIVGTLWLATVIKVAWDLGRKRNFKTPVLLGALWYTAVTIAYLNQQQASPE